MGRIARVLFGRKPLDRQIEDVEMKLMDPVAPAEQVDELFEDFQQLMMDKVTEAREDNLDLRTEVSELKKQISALRKSYSDVRRKLAEEEALVESQIKEATVEECADRDVAVAKAGAAEDRLEALEGHLRVAQDDLEKEPTSRATMCREISILSEKIASLRCEKEALGAATKALAVEVVGGGRALGEAEAERRELLERLAAEQGQAQDVARQLGEVELTNWELLESNAAIQVEASKLVQKVALGEAGVQARRRDIDSLEANAAAVAKLKLQLAASQAEVAGLQRTVEVAEQEREAELETREIMTDEAQQLSVRLDASLSEVRALEERRAELDGAVATLRAREAALEAEMAQAEDAAREERDQLQRELTTVQGELRTLTEKVVGVRGESASLQQRVSAADRAIVGMEERAESAQAEKSELESQADAAEAERERLQDGVDELCAAREEADQQSRAIGSEVQRLTVQLVETDAANARHSETLHTLSEETSGLHSQVSILEARKARSVDRISSYQIERVQLAKSAIKMHEEREALVVWAGTASIEKEALLEELRKVLIQQRRLERELAASEGGSEEGRELAVLRFASAAPDSSPEVPRESRKIRQALADSGQTKIMLQKELVQTEKQLHELESA